MIDFSLTFGNKMLTFFAAAEYCPLVWIDAHTSFKIVTVDEEKNFLARFLVENGFSKT